MIHLVFRVQREINEIPSYVCFFVGKSVFLHIKLTNARCLSHTNSIGLQVIGSEQPVTSYEILLE